MYCLIIEKATVNFVWVTGRELVLKGSCKEEKPFEQDLERWVRTLLEDTQQGVKRKINSTMSWNVPCEGIKMSTTLLILIQYIFLLVDNFNGFISIPFGISALPLNSTNLLVFFLHLSWIWHIDNRDSWPDMKMCWKVKDPGDHCRGWSAPCSASWVFSFSHWQNQMTGVQNEEKELWSVITTGMKNFLRKLISQLLLQPASGLNGIKPCNYTS